MADEIMKDIASLRDNYMRQLQVQGRPAEGFAFIAGKVEAANMILEILRSTKNKGREVSVSHIIYQSWAGWLRSMAPEKD